MENMENRDRLKEAEAVRDELRDALHAAGVTLPSLRQAGQAQKKGETWHLLLNDKSRGKVVIGDVTVLFRIKNGPLFETALAAALASRSAGHGELKNEKFVEDGVTVQVTRSSDGRVRRHRASKRQGLNQGRVGIDCLAMGRSAVIAWVAMRKEADPS